MSNAYETVTNQIIKMLENGTVPWKKSWTTNSWPKNLTTGKRYSGINAVMLGVMGHMHSSSYWLTFAQTKQLGGYVRKGERGTGIIFFSMLEKEIVKKDMDGQERRVKVKTPCWRSYTVFNADQCDGLKSSRLEEEKSQVVLNDFQKLESAEKVINGYKGCPEIIHAGTSACYRPELDEIVMPDRGRFVSSESYYATLFHEAVHSTGHKKRIGRDGVTGGSIFGDTVYSKEELIAEFGAAFLCSEAGIENDQVIENQAAYIQGWLKYLKNNPKELVFAASAAQKAADYVIGNKND